MFLEFIPKSDEDFARLCVWIYRRVWNAPDAQQVGRRGQRQHGVDIFGRRESDGRKFGAQCKKRETGKKLTLAEVLPDIEQARGFVPKLDHFQILTTAPRDTELLCEIESLCDESVRAGFFSIGIAFWDDLQERLHEYPDIAESVYGGASASKVNEILAALKAVPQLSPDAIITSANDEIDRAAALLRSGKPAIALDRLNDIRDKRYDALDPRRKYRVDANTATALLALGNVKGAAAGYERACRVFPDDPDARICGAFALHLCGERARAFAAADELRRAFPDKPRAWMIWIANAPAEVPTDQLAAEVPRDVALDSEVAFVLSRRCHERGDIEEAVRYALASIDAVDSPPAFLLLQGGAILLAAELLRARTLPDRLVVPGPARVAQAIDLFDKALAGDDRIAPPALMPTIRMKRAVAHRLLGHEDEAAADIEAAFHSAPTDPDVATHFAMLVRDRGDLDRAIAVLEGAVADDAPCKVAFLKADYLWARGNQADKAAADAILLAALKGTPQQGDLPQAECAFLLVAHMVESARFADALALLDEQHGRTMEGVQYQALRARVLHEMGDVDRSVEAAKRAHDSLGADAALPILRDTAVSCQMVGLYREAAAIWRRTVPDTAVGPDTHRFLHCALRAGEDGAILEFCALLRANGVRDSQCLDCELDVLLRCNDYSGARALLRAWIEECPGDAHARLRLSILAIRKGWDTDIERNADSLPSPKEVPPKHSGALIYALRHTTEPMRAVDAAYDIVRRNFDVAEAHLALIFAVLGPPEIGLPRPTVVAPATAVGYTEHGSDEVKWSVIEDSGAVQPALGEITPDHELARALLGAVVGDTVVVGRGTLAERPLRVREIRDKRHHRFLDCSTNLDSRFSGRTDFIRFSVPTKPSGELDAESLLQRMLMPQRAIEQGLAPLKAQYASQPIPLGTLARTAHRSVFVMTGAAIQDPNMPLWACLGTSEEFTRASELLDEPTALLADPCALGTLFWSDTAHLLEATGKTLVVTESTMAQIEEEIERVSGHGREGGIAMKDGEGLRYVPFDDPGLRSYRDRLASFRKAILTGASIVGGTPVTRVDAGLRATLLGALGSASLESAAVAVSEGIPLWSDEAVCGYAMGMISKERRVWTQVLFEWALSRGKVSVSDYGRLVAWLLTSGYRFTRLSIEVFLEIGAIAAWKADAEPLASAIAHLGAPTIAPSSLVGLVLGVASRLRKRPEPSDEQIKDVTVAVLRSVGQRPKDGSKLLTSIGKHADEVFRIDVPGAQQVRQWAAELANERPAVRGLVLLPRVVL